MDVRIASVGLATAQGSVTDIVAGDPPRPPGDSIWGVKKWTACHRQFSALGISPSVTGSARWRELAVRALEDCYGGRKSFPETALLLASCNGASPPFERESWRRAFDSAALIGGTELGGKNLPVFSSSCNSGMHALLAAQRLLLSGYAKEIVVLAVDILSAANHNNFEVLRVLTDHPAHWQSTAVGFIPGEAAVALRLVITADEDAPLLGEIVLGSDIPDHDGLRELLGYLNLENVELIVGQGTGPYRNDMLELAAIEASIPSSVPLTTTLRHFGHTLGASSLLSIALSTLAWRKTAGLRYLQMHRGGTFDGRPLFRSDRFPSNVLVSCRAMNGSCAAVTIGNSRSSTIRTGPHWNGTDGMTCAPPPLMHPVLRKVWNEASHQRPKSAPDLLIVKMDAPLIPDARAIIGDRLLPSAVLELTPGFVSQLVARSWSFTGGTMCLVGGTNTDLTTNEMMRGLEDSRLKLSRMWLRGDGDDRTIEWEV